MNEIHSCHVCAIPAPRFLTWVGAWENGGATNWDKEKKRRYLSACLMCPWTSKTQIPIRKLTIPVWNLREESLKYKCCAQIKRLSFFSKVLVFNSLTWDELYCQINQNIMKCHTMAFTILKSRELDWFPSLSIQHILRYPYIWTRTEIFMTQNTIRKTALTS